MDNRKQPIKRLLLKVAICRNDKDTRDIYITDDIINLGLKDPVYNDGCKFLAVDDVITLDNKKYQVERIIFRLDPPTSLEDTIPDLRTDNEDAWESNCQLSVFVKDYGD